MIKLGNIETTLVIGAGNCGCSSWNMNGGKQQYMAYTYNVDDVGDCVVKCCNNLGRAYAMWAYENKIGQQLTGSCGFMK